MHAICCCRPTETNERAELQNDDVELRRLSTLHYSTIVAVSSTDGQSNDTFAIYHTNIGLLSRYRYLHDGAVWHVQSITLDTVRGHCNGTRYVMRQICRRYIEVEIACSRQRSSCGYRCGLGLYSEIASCTWRMTFDFCK